VLLGAVALRGVTFNLDPSGVLWFTAAALCFAIAMYGVAEVLANRIHTQEEYIGALPPVAVIPFFFAGSFFPISALPAWLTAFAKALPITHLVALMRYGLIRNPTGLHDIWGMTNPSVMAASASPSLWSSPHSSPPSRSASSSAPPCNRPAPAGSPPPAALPALSNPVSAPNDRDDEHRRAEHTRRNANPTERAGGSRLPRRHGGVPRGDVHGASVKHLEVDATAAEGGRGDDELANPSRVTQPEWSATPPPRL
jgi:hypothetical protein